MAKILREAISWENSEWVSHGAPTDLSPRFEPGEVRLAMSVPCVPEDGCPCVSCVITI